MTPHSKYSEKGVFNLGSHHTANDGISENALNLALFLLCIVFLSLSMASSAWSLHESNDQLQLMGNSITEAPKATEPATHYGHALNNRLHSQLALANTTAGLGSLNN